ncbi:MAG: hypothetical protein AAB215_01650 [Planctomycetota bacterium]
MATRNGTATRDAAVAAKEALHGFARSGDGDAIERSGEDFRILRGRLLRLRQRRPELAAFVELSDFAKDALRRIESPTPEPVLATAGR